MEDVDSHSTRQQWVWCLFTLLCVAQTTLYAASQGRVGESSSRGTISISLVIPEFTRLVAEVESTTTLKKPKLCMHVVNPNDRTIANYYRVAGLTSTLNTNYESELVDLDKSVQLVTLNNNYKSRNPTNSLCDYQNELANKLKNKKNQTILFVLVAE